MELLMRIEIRSFFPSDRNSFLAGVAVAALLAAAPMLRAQNTPDTPAAPTPQPAAQTTQPAAANPDAAAPAQTAAPATAAPAQADATLSNTSTKPKKPKVAKTDRLQETKDTKAELKKEAKYNPLIGKDAQLPDKQLYDKAMVQTNGGHYDIARLDLQALLDTYPESQYMMRAKLAVADAWYKEGGSAALTEAEQEYKDFITFFPNVPEAAEAQLRVGDIYFKQMDVPDRDYAKGTHAEEEYRTMLKQYPDAPKQLIDEARQKLREVQEVMAEREAQLGAFYATHSNWAASMARYQTVIDTYPLYSHMDDTMIGMGDDYAAESAMIRSQAVCAGKPAPGVPCVPEGVKAKLLEEYDGKAADYYRQVVLLHSAAPHAEDAKERLAGMNLPIPEPTKEQAAASEELEGSRAQYNLQKRLELFFMHRPDTVTAAQTGIPTLEDPPPTVAPTMVRNLMANYIAAYHPDAHGAAAAAPAAASGTTPAASAGGTSETPAATTPAAPESAAPPTLSDVPAEGSTDPNGTSKTVTVVEPAASSGGGSGTGLGVEILTPGAGGAAPATGTPASTLPAATGAQDPNFGLPAPSAKTAALPPIEKAAEAPDQVNEAAGKSEPAAQVADPNAKNKKKKKAPKEDKTDESSSKNKPKKGLDKLNPF
jgi:outer membrane protein assembly factor BamD